MNQEKKEKSLASFKSLSDENLKRDLIKNIIKGDSSKYNSQVDFNDLSQEQIMLKNFPENNSRIHNTKKTSIQKESLKPVLRSELKGLHNANFGTIRKMKEQQSFCEEENLILERLQKEKKSDLKLDYDACKVNEKEELFESQNDVMPSLMKFQKDIDSKKKLQQVNATNIDFRYDYVQIIYEYFVLKGRFPLDNKLNQEFNFNKQKNMSSEEIQNAIQMFIKFNIQEGLQRIDFYYPLQIPNSKLILDHKEKLMKEDDFEDKKQRNAKLMQINQQKIKKIKQTSKNFANMQQFFQDEFEDEEENENDYQAQKKAIQEYFCSVINNDFSKGEISSKNWSGWDIVDLHTFSLHKLQIVTDQLNKENLEKWIPGLRGKILISQRMVRTFITSKFMEGLILLMVFLNTLILSLEGLLDQKYKEDIMTLNNVFTFIFVFEMMTKIYGFGFRGYCRKKINLFDAGLSLLSLFELFMEGSENFSNAFKTVKVFRSFRVLRVTRLLRTLKFMKVITEVIMASLEQFAYIGLLLLLLLIIFSLIGMQLFGGQFNFENRHLYPRQSFDTFLDAFLSVFQIMTMENWNEILYLAWCSQQYIILSLIYLLFWIFLGNYIILNLFLAILLEGFTNVKIQQETIELDYEEEQIKDMQAKIKKELILNQLEKEKKMEFLANLEKFDPYKEQRENNRRSIFQKDLRRVNGTMQSFSHAQLQNTDNPNPTINSTTSEDDEQNNTTTLQSQIQLSKSTLNDNVECQDIQAKIIYNNISCENSFFIFSKNNKIRAFIGQLTLHRYFENIILVLILINCVILMVETYFSEKNESTIKTVLNTIDQIITYGFILEFIMKSVTNGFVLCPNSYLRDPWSILDFVIVLTSLIDLFFSNQDYPIIKILKVFRVLRPLRFLTHYENLRVVLEALIESIKGIFNIMIVILMVWLMFGILGINLLSGKMGYCLFEDKRSYYNINFYQCSEQGGVWTTWGWNFDNIFNALVTLFVLSSTEGWPQIMQTAQDSNTRDQGPSFYSNYYICFYHLIFIFVGSLFLMNLFVGFIFYQFTQEQEKEKQKKFKLVTTKQMKWILMQKLIADAEPNSLKVSLTKNRFQLFLYKIVMSKLFEYIIMSCIILNIIAMAMIYDNMSIQYENYLDIINIAFSFIFFFEAFIKICALGGRRYFTQGWNQFDFSIVVISMLDFVLIQCFNIQTLTIYPQLAKVLRVLRITRLFKLMKSKTFQSFNKIIRTLIFSFPALFNVLLLLMLIYFIFSILGVFVFKDIDPDFENFGTAILNLFKYSTGEDWHLKMYALADQKPWISKFFFLTFIFFSSFIMINMFVLIVLEQFENFYFNPDNPINTFEDVTEHFREIWNLYCDESGKKIKQGDIYHFFVSLESPYGFFLPCNKEEKFDIYDKNFKTSYFLSVLKFDPNYVRRKIAKMNLLIDSEGYVHFGQVLHAAMKIANGVKSNQTNRQTYLKIKSLEEKTLQHILKKNKVTQNVFKKQQKIVNPFTNLLFLQLVYQTWYANAKKKLMKKSQSLINLDSNESISEFEEKVLNTIQIPKFQTIRNKIIFQEQKSIDKNLENGPDQIQL